MRGGAVEVLRRVAALEARPVVCAPCEAAGFLGGSDEVWRRPARCEDVVRNVQVVRLAWGSQLAAA